jgi:hypothetical protein
MVEEDIWRVTDLLDTEQPFVEDVQLARQMVQTLHALDAFDREIDTEEWHESRTVSLNVRTPKAALQFVENTLSEWFETVAEIEKRRGNMPYLIDRTPYPEGEFEWNQGLTLDSINSWTEEHDLIDIGRKHGFTYGEEYPFRGIWEIEEPLSGYYNRLLPVKFVLRALAILTLNSESFDKKEGWDPEAEFEEGISLDTLREKAWSAASYARPTLEKMERKIGADRGAGISVGFPGGETQSKITKSKERFVSQFVGSKRKNELSGALFDMGFANMGGFGVGNILRFTSDEIWFTAEGWRFATMENPVIDQIEGWEEGNRFSDEEIEFLLAHFKNNVSVEWKFMQSIVDMIRNGIDDAISMNAELIRENEWNRSKASVYRTGVIARMQELGLVDRVKTGVEVKFVLTDSSKTYFALK